jgi:hypothetical protein
MDLGMDTFIFIFGGIVNIFFQACPMYAMHYVLVQIAKSALFTFFYIGQTSSKAIFSCCCCCFRKKERNPCVLLINVFFLFSQTTNPMDCTLLTTWLYFYFYFSCDDRDTCSIYTR